MARASGRQMEWRKTMRSVMFAAIAAATLATAPLAWAGEGNTGPIGQTPVVFTPATTFQSNTAAGTVESANSLPSGALDRTSDYSHSVHMKAYWARQGEAPTVAQNFQPNG
jgi:hypothetical protein